jgi:hypothetical protein
MGGLESNSYDILDYYPNGGERYEENGRIVYWNTFSGNSLEAALQQMSDNGQKPLEAREIDTPDGRVIIVKWEAQLATEANKPE